MRDGLAGTILLMGLVVVAVLWAVGIGPPWVTP